MSLALRFHKYLLIPILSEWLSAFELIDFDTSLCSKKERQYLFELIHEYPNKFIPIMDEVALLSVKFMDWCDVRRINNSDNQEWKLKVTSRSLSVAFENSVLDSRLVSHFTKITSLEFLNADQTHLEAIIEVTKNATNVKCLEFTGVNNLGKLSQAAILDTIATHCPKLKSLVLPESFSDEPCAVGSMQQLFHTSPGLEKACIVSRSFELPRITASLIVRCPDLQEVILQCSDAIPKKAVSMLALMRSQGGGSSNNKALLTSFTGRPLSDKTLLALLWYKGSALTSLNISNSYEITDVSVGAIGRACPALRVLNLSQCHRVTDAGITALVVSDVRDSLESVNLSGLMSLRSGGVLTLGMHCSRLNALELRLQSLLDLTTLSSACFHGLRRLTLIFLGVTDAVLKAIAQRCTQLEELSINHNSLVTDESVVAVAQHCRGLRVLHMKSLARVTDVSLFALAEHCPMVVDLVLSGCDISDEGVTRITERCFDLERIALHLLPRVTFQSMVRLSGNCGYLKTLCFDTVLVEDRHAEFGELVLRRLKRLQCVTVGSVSKSKLKVNEECAELTSLVASVNGSIAFVLSNEVHLASSK